ncbi:hypothetical protein COOONC_02103 [Cooperia oncophora]
MHFVHYDHAGPVNLLLTASRTGVQDSLSYKVALHLVHVRQGLTLQEAVRKPDGIAVVGVFLIIGHDGTSMASVSHVLG